MAELGRMMDVPERLVSEVVRAERASVRRAVHTRAKELFDRVQGQAKPRGSRAEWARQRARERGWLRPIELEEDLIDVPEPWASRQLAARAAQMDSTARSRRYRSVVRGERSELAVAASELFKDEYNRRRRERSVQ